MILLQIYLFINFLFVRKISLSGQCRSKIRLHVLCSLILIYTVRNRSLYVPLRNLKFIFRRKLSPSLDLKKQPAGNLQSELDIPCPQKIPESPLSSQMLSIEGLFDCIVLNAVSKRYFIYIAATNAPIHAFLELFQPAFRTIFCPSHWLLSSLTIVGTTDSGDREMNPVAMTIINPRKKYWQSWGIGLATSCSQVRNAVD